VKSLFLQSFIFLGKATFLKFMKLARLFWLNYSQLKPVMAERGTVSSGSMLWI